jgi:hypothetical protein
MYVFQTHMLIIMINVWGKTVIPGTTTYIIFLLLPDEIKENIQEMDHIVISCGVNLAVTVILCKNYGHPQTGKL